MFELFAAKKTRKQWGQHDAKRDEGRIIPPEVEVLPDIPYGTNRKYHLLDINQPKGAKGKLPVIINCHGGGYFYGTKETYRFYASELAKSGFRVVNFSYRLAPEWKFPAPIQDAIAVLDWVKSHAEEYGFDLENVFLVGDSAGANLAFTLGVMASNPDYAKLFPFPMSTLPILGMCLNCGIYEDPVEGMIAKFYLPKRVCKANQQALRATAYLTSSFPPCIIMSSNGDFLLREANPLYIKMKEKGIDARLSLFMPKETKLRHVFHIDIDKPYAKKANQEQIEFLQALIKKGK